MLDCGADIHEKDQYGDTPLHSAADHGQTEVVALLLKNGADINAEDDLGNTPLHLAAWTWAD